MGDLKIKKKDVSKVQKLKKSFNFFLIIFQSSYLYQT
jgi:hypothetical protein